MGLVCATRYAGQHGHDGSVRAPMTLFGLIKQEIAGSRPHLILAAGLSGLANAGLLVLINTAIHDTSTDRQDFHYLLIFAVAFIIYAICFRRTTNRVTVVLEKYSPHSSTHCGENSSGGSLES